MSYLNELKIAVINGDLSKLAKLADKKAVFENVEEAQEIKAYLTKATELLEAEKEKLKKEMQTLKNMQKFNSHQTKETFDFKA